MDYFEYDFPISRPDAVLASVITDKGYITLPEEFLADTDFQADEADAVLTNSWKKGVLTVYTKDFFKEVEGQLAVLNKMNPRIRMLHRMIICEACDTKMKNGRIDVDPELCDRLGFDLDKAEPDGFPVMLLKYKEKIWIATLSAYEEIEKKLQEQDNETP